MKAKGWTKCCAHPVFWRCKTCLPFIPCYLYPASPWHCGTPGTLVTGPPGGLHCDQVSLGSQGTIYTLATMLGPAGTRAELRSFKIGAAAIKLEETLNTEYWTGGWFCSWMGNVQLRRWHASSGGKKMKLHILNSIQLNISEISFY